MPSLERGTRASGPTITGFSGKLIKVDGTIRPGGVVLTPEAAHDWDGASLDAALDLDPPPEFVLLGTGQTLEQPDAVTRAALAAKGIGIEAMDTRAASRAWIVLRAEGRWISAALRPL